jgi:hypothetical protein
MGAIRRFADECKKAKWALLLNFLFCCFLQPLPMAGQYLGNVGQASTQTSFAANPHNIQQIIPPCSASVTTNCIKMIGQVSHNVVMAEAGSVECGALLDGSLDGVTWETLASIYFTTSFTAPRVMVANGYYPLLRLKLNPGGVATCAAMTGSYSGFQTPLPISNLTQTVYQSAAAVTQVDSHFTTALFNIPSLVEGFACSNTNASVAWLQLFDATSAPTLGTGFLFQIGLPANGTFVFPAGNAFLLHSLLWMGAATAAGGSTAVGTAVACNFQMNYWGPFSPLNPFSP